MRPQAPATRRRAGVSACGVVAVSVALDGAMLHASSFPYGEYSAPCAPLTDEGQKGSTMSAARGLTPGKEWAIVRKKQEVADMGEVVLERRHPTLQVAGPMREATCAP